jgi:hypothetical protein
MVIEGIYLEQSIVIINIGCLLKRGFNKKFKGGDQSLERNL